MLSSLLFSVYKLVQESTQPENMGDIVCDKAKDRGGSKQNEWLCRSSHAKEFYIKRYSEKFCTLWICKFIKIDTLVQLLSCEFCEICKITFFAEHHRVMASDYSSIKISEAVSSKRNYKL